MHRSEDPCHNSEVQPDPESPCDLIDALPERRADVRPEERIACEVGLEAGDRDRTWDDLSTRFARQRNHREYRLGAVIGDLQACLDRPTLPIDVDARAEKRMDPGVASELPGLHQRQCADPVGVIAIEIAAYVWLALQFFETDETALTGDRELGFGFEMLGPVAADAEADSRGGEPIAEGLAAYTATVGLEPRDVARR